MKLFRKNRKLGVAEGKRRYDLPFNKDAGTGFLVLLIGLMTFLAVIALSSSFILSAIGQRWSSGLENKITIEIPAETPKGELRTESAMAQITGEIKESVLSMPEVLVVQILEKQEIKDLISPWLGDDIMLEDMPLPGLVSVELRQSSPELIETLKSTLNAIAPDIVLDTHDEWLEDILALTETLQITAIFITVLIAFTTFTAVAGAIRSRMAVHKEDVELLHLMGAGDRYIMKQFQRHAFFMSLKGSLVGGVAGVLIIASAGLIAGNTNAEILPQLSLSVFHLTILCLLPVFACLIGAVTARFTVLHELGMMP